ncbi:uncharacterized protein C9orf85 homolog [Cephus cinctus]|uniref:Uncharacterized protein C9orf85 homolog n=1 Tax=Cephus cinctus TaxID=211228 RepID=A0AAJ7FMC7_CEPCN|nr:uncharacterized protein C9orf85 homolog [Cephus cinctus]XP_015598920.1 uncharacterized protein C9orf85 homolog [Cephus cinctus]
MSSQKGNTSRSRPQKYQNRHVFKNDLHDKSHKTKFINSLHIANVCERCKRIIEWKIKYKKYKPLKAPTKCTKCDQKCVKHAYHIMCGPCAGKDQVCPKCGTKGEIVIGQPTPQEQIKLDSELQALLKSLPERKKRTFLRYMNKSNKVKKDKSKTNENKNDLSPEKQEQDNKEESVHEPVTRQELLDKLNSLIIKDEFDDDLDSDSENDDFDSED